MNQSGNQQTFLVRAKATQQGIMVTDGTGYILFNCRAIDVRGVLDLVSRMIDEDIPAMITENGASLDSDYELSISLNLPCKEMVLRE